MDTGSLVLALIFAVTFNVDSIRIARDLWAEPVLAEKVKASQQITDISAALVEMNSTFPVGWPKGEIFVTGFDANGKPIWMNANDWLMSILGWVITTLATLFGTVLV